MSVTPGQTFTGADLTGRNFNEKDMRGCNFINCRLRGADFVKTVLRGADFTGADLRGADFDSADLRGADFTDAVLDGCTFADANISGAIMPEKRQTQTTNNSKTWSGEWVCGNGWDPLVFVQTDKIVTGTYGPNKIVISGIIGSDNILRGYYNTSTPFSIAMSADKNSFAGSYSNGPAFTGTRK